MKLYDILDMIDPKTTDVRFWESTDLCVPPIHVTTMNVDSLYKDWYDEALNCPENGTFIYGVTFCSYDGKAYLLDNSAYGEFPFEELMDAIHERYYDEDHNIKY